MRGNVMRLVRRKLALASVFAIAFASDPASAQLVDATQVTPNVPGGQIGKSLDQQIGAGHGNDVTPSSAVYLIKRDPARSVRRGRQIFQRKFTEEQGQGPRVSETSTGNIRTTRALGAG